MVMYIVIYGYVICTYLIVLSDLLILSLQTDSYQIGIEDGSEIVKLSNLGCGKDINKGPTSAYTAPDSMLYFGYQ